MNRQTTTSGDKLKQAFALVDIELLHCLPEPLDNDGVGTTVFQPSVSHPVFYVDSVLSVEKQLSKIEHGGCLLELSQFLPLALSIQILVSSR